MGLHEGRVHFLYARPTAALKAFEPSTRKIAVFRRHLHQVRKRPECDQVQIFHRSLYAEAAEQGANKLVRNADTAKFRVRVIVAFLMRVQKHIAHREPIARRLMMVHDHDRHAEFLGVCNFHVRGNTRIHGNQVARPRLIHFIDGRNRKSVAIAKAVRESPFRFNTHSLEAAGQKRHGRHAVQVVVAKNEHALATFANREYPFHSLVHPHHEEGVMHVALVRAQHVVRIRNGLDAARDQEPRDRMRNL